MKSDRCIEDMMNESSTNQSIFFSRILTQRVFLQCKITLSCAFRLVSGAFRQNVMQKQAQFTIRKATLSSYIKKKARMIRAFCIFSQYRTTIVSRWHTRASAGGCAKDTQSDFSSACIDFSQEYYRIPRERCARWRKICKWIWYKAVRRSLCGVAFMPSCLCSP